MGFKKKLSSVRAIFSSSDEDDNEPLVMSEKDTNTDKHGKFKKKKTARRFLDTQADISDEVCMTLLVLWKSNKHVTEHL